mgnify:CR=1 FL=1
MRDSYNTCCIKRLWREIQAYGDDYYPLALGEIRQNDPYGYYLESVYGTDWVTGDTLNYTKDQIVEGLEFIQSLEDAHVIPSIATIAGDGAASLDQNQNWIDGHYAGIFLYDTSIVKHAEAVKDGEFVIGDYIKMGDYHGGFIKVNQAFGISATTEHPASSGLTVPLPQPSRFEILRFLSSSKDCFSTHCSYALLRLRS